MLRARLLLRQGEEVLDEITYYSTVTTTGVPAYRVGSDAHSMPLVDGSTFLVTDGHGNTETVTFHAADFADIGNADAHEIEHALNEQLTIARAEIVNASITLSGMEGGAGAQLTFAEGSGALAALGLGAGTVLGADDIELVLSVPGGHDHSQDHQSFPFHPYVVVASTTPGVTPVGEVELPLGFDGTSAHFLRAMDAGLLPGFTGLLDAGSDGLATLPGALLFPAGLPSELYLSYVVLSPDLSSAVYVSNRFTVHIVQ